MEKTWTASTIENPRQIIELVGMQAITDVLLDPMQDEQAKVVKYLQTKGLTWKTANDIDAFYFHYAVEAAELGIRMGFAMAGTVAPYADFEEWMLAASEKAGLRGYTLREGLSFEAPKE